MHRSPTSPTLYVEYSRKKEEMFIESDYSQILQRVAQHALDGAKILYGKYVNRVETPVTRDSGEKVRISTSAGERMEADEVIMTTPLGWLQVNQPSFHPPLPERLARAINNITLSHLEKVYIKFPKAFWISEAEHLSISSSTFPGYVTWLSPTYAQDTNPQAWPQEIWECSTSAPPHNHPTILFYLYGDCSRHIVNAIHGLPQSSQFTFLANFFAPYFSKLPNYSASNPDCSPEKILATEWLKDELSGNASYCNFQVGIEEGDRDVERIREGCVERRMWFCGEHCAPFEETGTVTGAFLSGERIAGRVVELYSTNK